MIRQPVSSSTLRSVGYDPLRSELEVEFNNGSVYVYASVPQSVYNGLMAATSHGGYFDRMVKKGGYQYRQIR